MSVEASIVDLREKKLELVAKLTFQIAVRDDGTSQHHQGLMRSASGLFSHPQLPELMQP
jgi:hypothetical protein